MTKKRRRVTPGQLQKLEQRFADMRAAAERSATVKDALETMLPDSISEEYPAVVEVLAGFLAGDDARVARAAHMLVQRRLTKDKLEQVAVDAGAQLSDDKPPSSQGRS